MIIRSGRGKGFTLIELLVVMAISAVLMGLVLYPVVKSFQLTRSSQTMVEAQDTARFAMGQITREIGEAMFVYDNSIVGYVPSGDLPPGTILDQGQLQLPVRNGTDIIWVMLPEAKIDFVLPKMSMHCNNPTHPATIPRDYPRYKIVDEQVYYFASMPCPACENDGQDPNDVEIRPELPLRQDVTVVRYFLGLRFNDPNAANFGWVSPWGKNVVAGEENQVVLYRVEFDPSDNDLFPEEMSYGERLIDPVFFYRPGFAENWARIAKIVGSPKYQDLVVQDPDSETIEPTVQFRFTRVNDDTFTPAYYNDVASEYTDSAPVVYRAKYGSWIPGYTIVLRRRDSTGAEFSYEGSEAEIRKYALSGGVKTQVAVWNIASYLSGRSSTHPEMVFGIRPELLNIPAARKLFGEPGPGEVVFAVDPPDHGDFVHELDALAINQAYDAAALLDRDSARRADDLILVNPSASNCPRIVPGSEEVWGLDMMGRDTMVQFKRVPYNLGDAGYNQYRINYDTGEIFFSSRPGIRLNSGEKGLAKVNVSYKICFNRPGDVVKGSYQTKSLVTVHLGMRVFDPDSSKPHNVELNDTVKIRNSMR